MLSTYITIASVSFLAAMSPGPDFFMVLKNSLTRGRIHGMLTAVGVGIALVVHSLVIGVGLGALIETSVVAYQIIKIAGALYLLYLAYQLLFSSEKTEFNATPDALSSEVKYSFITSLLDGFLTNILNPKALVFIIALYTQLFGSDATILQYFIAGTIIGVITCLWFIFLSYLVNISYIRKSMNSFGGFLQKLFGVILGGLGLKVLLE